MDNGPDIVPAAPGHDPADLAESGRGLGLVELLATQWGHHGQHAIDAGNGNAKRTPGLVSPRLPTRQPCRLHAMTSRHRQTIHYRPAGPRCGPVQSAPTALP